MFKSRYNERSGLTPRSPLPGSATLWSTLSAVPRGAQLDVEATHTPRSRHDQLLSLQATWGLQVCPKSSSSIAGRQKQSAQSALAPDGKWGILLISLDLPPLGLSDMYLSKASTSSVKPSSQSRLAWSLRLGSSGRAGSPDGGSGGAILTGSERVSCDRERLIRRTFLKAILNDRFHGLVNPTNGFPHGGPPCRGGLSFACSKG